MSKLNENGIEVKGHDVVFKENRFFKDASPFFIAAFQDILEKKSGIYRDAIKKGVQVNISLEFPSEGFSEFNLKEQVKSFMEDMK